MDKEVGDELAQIKECISEMGVNALPYAGQVGQYVLFSCLYSLLYDFFWTHKILTQRLTLRLALYFAFHD
jgi:hypothetical protein